MAATPGRDRGRPVTAAPVQSGPFADSPDEVDATQALAIVRDLRCRLNVKPRPRRNYYGEAVTFELNRRRADLAARVERLEQLVGTG